MRYAVVIEKVEGNYSAYVPDLPGCVATGDSVEAVEAQIREAIRFHIDGLKADGALIPKPQASPKTSKRNELPGVHPAGTSSVPSPKREDISSPTN
jgi:predicted RNase H-like HicB family nuclease